MKSQFQLGIPKPCSEKFDSFEPRPEGGFCKACQTTVVDFSELSDTEIRNFFAHSTEKVCGRFKSSQLKRYSVHRKPESNYWGLRAAVLTIPLLSVIPFTEAQAQNVVAPVPVEQGLNPSGSEASPPKNGIIQGKVVDGKTGESVPFANVYLKNPSRGTATDIEGNFKIASVSLGDTLEVSFVGYEIKKVVIESLDNLIIKLDEGDVMLGQVVYLMGEVESPEVYQRKRSFMDRLKNFFFD